MNASSFTPHAACSAALTGARALLMVLSGVLDRSWSARRWTTSAGRFIMLTGW